MIIPPPSMLKTLTISTLALLILAGCAATPVRDFRADYGRSAAARMIKIDGYPPFRVAELHGQRRLKVELNVLAQAFNWSSDPFVLLGFSNGIPPQAAHEAAARVYLAETRRSSCVLADPAISPSGREYEFRFNC